MSEELPNTRRTSRISFADAAEKQKVPETRILPKRFKNAMEKDMNKTAENRCNAAESAPNGGIEYSAFENMDRLAAIFAMQKLLMILRRGAGWNSQLRNGNKGLCLR